MLMALSAGSWTPKAICAPHPPNIATLTMAKWKVKPTKIKWIATFFIAQPSTVRMLLPTLLLLLIHIQICCVEILCMQTCWTSHHIQQHTPPAIRPEQTVWLQQSVIIGDHAEQKWTRWWVFCAIVCCHSPISQLASIWTLYDCSYATLAGDCVQFGINSGCFAF